MILHKNVSFYVFIIIKLYFVGKINGNSTAADVEDYLVPVYDMDKYMEYYVPKTRSTRARSTPAKTTGDRTTQARTMPTGTTRNRTPPPGITPETSRKRIITTSGTTPRSTEPSFKPIDFLVTITPEQINSFVTNMDLLNKTIVEQTKFLYGKDRPDKYKNVVYQLLDYFKSIAGPEWLPDPPTNAGNSPQTEPPLEDYDIQPDHKHQTIPEGQQLQSPPMIFDDDEYPQTNLPLYSTLKPVTDNDKLINRSKLNKARNGAKYDISTKSTIPHQTKPGQEQTQTPSVKLHDRQKTTPSIKLHNQTRIPIKLHERQQKTLSSKLNYQQQKTSSNKLHYKQQKTPSIKLNYQQQKTPSIKLNYQQQKTPSIKLNYQQQKTPSIKLNNQQQKTPSIQLNYQQRKTPSIKLNNQQQKTPSIQLNYQQQKTPSIKLNYQQQKTPSIKLNYQQQKTPSIKLNYQQQKTSSNKLNYQQQKSPSINLNYQQQKTPSIKLNYQQQKTPSNKLNYQQQKTPLTKLHQRQQTQPPMILYVRHQTRTPNKLHVRQQNDTSSIPDQQETQSAPPQQVDAYEDLILVTIEYPTDAGYYDLDAITGSKGYSTSIGDFNSTLGTTEPPQPTTVHHIIKEIKTEMVEKEYGYMKGFLLGICTIIANKDPSQSQVLYGALRDVTMKMVKNGTFAKMGKRVENAVVALTLHINVLNPVAVKGYAAMGIHGLEVVHVLPSDVQKLLSNLDELYNVEEGEQLLASLVPIAEYPKSDNASVVAQNMMDKIFQPYFRAEGSPSAQSILQLINRFMEARNWGNRRLIKHLDYGFFDNNDFYKDVERDKNVRVNKMFDELNDKGRRKVILKELIDNVKAMEVLKKYRSERTHFTPNKLTNFYNVYDKSNYYHKRADFDQIKAMDDKKVDDFDKKSIQVDDKRDKMTDSDDGTSNDQVKRKENAEIKGPRKYKIRSGMDIDTDRLYGLTSESESESESEPKKHHNKMDKHMKHKIRHHLKHNHRKLYKKLKKLHDSNKRRQLKLKSKVLKNSKEQKRFNVVEEPQKPPFQDKTRAEDSDSKNQHSNEENRRLDNRRPYRRPPDTNRTPPGVNRRPPGNIIKGPDIIRRPPAAYRRPPGSYNRPPGANRRYPVNVRAPVANKRPPGANTRPPYDIIRPPYTTEPPSLYLTPKYKFNSRRFNENLNLTRRSNAKPISTELSYSNEEKDIKFNLQDALRHPIDLKPKIQQNSLIFDKVQNGRRQMAPVERNSLRDESSFSDDEGIIKNNIYKVFNKDI